MGAFEELASVNGTITPTAAATVPLKDDGLYRGDGAFEVIRLYEGKPFALADHLDRLDRSATSIELEFDRAALELEIDTLLTTAGPVDGAQAGGEPRQPQRCVGRPVDRICAQGAFGQRKADILLTTAVCPKFAFDWIQLACSNGGR